MIADNMSRPAPIAAAPSRATPVRVSCISVPLGFTHSTTVTPCNVGVLIMLATLWAAGPGVTLQPLGVAVVVPCAVVTATFYTVRVLRM